MYGYNYYFRIDYYKYFYVYNLFKVAKKADEELEILFKKHNFQQ